MRNNHFEGDECDGSRSGRKPDYTPEQAEQMKRELEAREAARQATAKRQATEQAIKIETGEIPLVSDAEYENIKRKYGIR